MPRIPKSKRRVAPNAASQSVSYGAGFSAPGRALAGLGKQLASLGSAFTSQQNDIDKFNTSKALSDLKARQDQAQFEADRSIEGDGSNHINNSLSRFDQDAQKVLSGLSGKSRDRADLLTKNIRLRLQNQAQSAQARHQDNYVFQEADNQIQGAIIPNITGNIEQIGQRLAAVDSVVDNSPFISSSKRMKLRGSAAQSAIQKFLSDTEAEEGLEQLENLPDIKENNLDVAKKLMAKVTDKNRENVQIVSQVAKEQGFDVPLALAIAHFESGGSFSTSMRPIGKNGKPLRLSNRYFSVSGIK